MKIPKLNHWSMELSDYGLTFVYVKGNDYILADVISRLKMLDIYMELIENWRRDAPNSTEEWITWVPANKIQILNTCSFCAKLNKDINCRNLAVPLCCKRQLQPSYDFYWWSSTKTTVCPCIETWHHHKTMFNCTNNSS